MVLISLNYAAADEQRISELRASVEAAQGEARQYLARIHEAEHLRELLSRIKQEVVKKDETVSMLNAWMAWQQHKAQAAADAAQHTIELERGAREKEACEAARALSVERGEHLQDLDELAASKQRHRDACEELRAHRDAVSVLVNELRAKVCVCV